MMSIQATSGALSVLVLAVTLVLPARAVTVTSPSASASSTRPWPQPRAVVHDPHTVLTSTSTGVRFKAAAGVDTFALYGGRGSLEGKFQEEFGNVPDSQGWITVDITDDPNFWQPSNFNASNLNWRGPTNRAYWCGRTAEQRAGWATPPGYGNSWDEKLVWSSGPIANPAAGQAVGLDFFFNYDLEPGEDYFLVEYQKGSTWIPVYEVSGSNRTGLGQFDPPGVQYSATPDHQPIVFSGSDYGGTGRNEIRIRLRVSTDGAWSDQDGLWPTSGAAQVDEIAVTWTSNGPKSSFADFQSTGPYAWKPESTSFVGDFAKLFFDFADLDPCRDNRTPTFSFIDDGTPPSNPANQPPIQVPPLGTGGSLSGTWSYGVAGGWVANFNGGLTNGLESLRNEIWSPHIAWDLPGIEDDGTDVRGALIRFSVWRHLPIQNGIFYVWHVRSSLSGGFTWSNWRDRGIVYWDRGDVQWYNHQANVTEYVASTATHVQLALGVRDLADLFAFPGTDATPAPLFDNAAFFKYRVQGPLITVQPTELFNDSFPQSGQALFDTPAQRGVADCRLDMAFDVNTGATAIIPGDSVVATIDAIIGGTTLESAKMVWILDRNPLFDEVRHTPAGVTEIAGGAANGWDQWTGEVVARLVPEFTNRYFFDLPDQDFMYPGDVLRTYLWARDTAGNESTLPRRIDAFADGIEYDRTFTVRALPSAVDDGQGGVETPEILFINGFGRGPAEEISHLAFAQNGWTAGVHYDTYTAQGPTARVSNGIGSSGAHGATASQLAAYPVIVYVAEDGDSTLLSDGSNVGTNDKSDDIGVLTAWQDQYADRFIVYFGDNIASALQESGSAGLTYLHAVMGVEVFDEDVRDDIDGQNAPTAIPQVPCFFESYVAYGGCDQPRTLDNIGPLGSGAIRSHGFATAGNPDEIYGAPGRVASILFDREEPNGSRKVNVTFPYGLSAVRHDVGETSMGPGSPSVRAKLLRELIFDCFQQPLAGGPPVAAEAVTRPELSQLVAYPNPFNPRTTIGFRLDASALVTVTIYDVRGQRVTTLHHGALPAGVHSFVWNGTDARKRAVASGTYVLRVVTSHGDHRRKVALIR